MLTIESSTPVINGGRMSYGNVVAVARFSVTGVDEGPGASNAIVAIASWSSIINEVKRRAMSLNIFN